MRAMVRVRRGMSVFGSMPWAAVGDSGGETAERGGLEDAGSVLKEVQISEYALEDLQNDPGW